MPGRIAENILQIQKSIPPSVRLVAVSKTQNSPAIREAHQAGQKEFGENYVREFLKKKRELIHDSIVWHFVGHLQRRKAKDVVGAVSLIHSLDSHSLALEIEKRASAKNIVQNALIEVNVGNEKSKSGVLPDEVASMLKNLNALPHLQITGLMTLPPFFEDPEKVRPYFRQLKELRDTLNADKAYRQSLNELSMGMSHDYQVAIEEGATIVRIGSAIFGERK